jgi:hypothetical protein
LSFKIFVFRKNNPIRPFSNSVFTLPPLFKIRSDLELPVYFLLMDQKDTLYKECVPVKKRSFFPFPPKTNVVGRSGVFISLVCLPAELNT